ncbi:pinin-like [Pyrus ussuriensis x Pyrus communis]|uniref:Pinin-like n=1 Tax=Pyrus ussuriensis x Pyrus communis TaxID=2448454 RepID=A0A5N5FLS5_9ROSA|nr:pinin-like [Pyrus ussuriensis x Pyrus communis]
MLAIMSNLHILCIRCLRSLCHTYSSRLIKCQYIDLRWLLLVDFVLKFQLGGFLECLWVLDLMWTCQGFLDQMEDLKEKVLKQKDLDDIQAQIRLGSLFGSFSCRLNMTL